MRKLIFIYNASKNILPNVPDAIRKATGGKGVCTLCNITWNPVSEKKNWKKFRKNLPIESEFLHKDDQPERISSYLKKEHLDLPIVLMDDGDLRVFIETKEIDACDGDENCLMEKIESRLNT